MGSLRLWNFVMRFRLASVNDIRKFHSILNEEYWNIVSDDIPITLSCVELYCKTSNISDSVCTTTATKNSGESNKNRSFSTRVSQYFGGGHICRTFKKSKHAKCTCPTSMNNTFWNPFVIKSMDLWFKV